MLMRKDKFINTIIVLIVSISVGILSFIFIKGKDYFQKKPAISEVQDTEIVTVTGRVIYDEFKKGDIEIYWTKKLNYGRPNIQSPDNKTYLPKPGFYILKVPKDSGDIYICARNRGSMYESFAYYISDPINIGLNDIRGYDITLKTKKLLMDDYEGETVRLSGKVFCGHCKKGIIAVCVYSIDWYRKVRLPPDIAKVTLVTPGDFSLEVPTNIGGVYLMAINIPEGERSGNSVKCLRASYINNPLIVKDADIKEIEITIN